MSKELIKVIYELEELDFYYPEINKFRWAVTEFSNACILRMNNREDILDLYKAVSLFETSLTILKSIIEPSGNKLIEKLNVQYSTNDILENYFGDFLSILDSSLAALSNNIGDSLVKIDNSYLATASIQLAREKLTGAMTDLIISPLVKSLAVFRDFMIKNRERIDCGKIGMEGGAIDLKDFFEYILLREVFISAKIKGAPSRLKSALSSGRSGASFYEKNIIKQGESKNRTEDTRKRDVPPDTDNIDFFGSLTENEEEEDEEGGEDGLD